jgi:6-phosphogluconolactonase
MAAMVVADASVLAREAAVFIANRATEAVARRGRFTLVLAGGGTPLEAYRLLGSQDMLPWSQCHFFMGDERCVPADDPASNWGQATTALGSPQGLPRDNLHPIHGQLSPQEAASDYEWRLRGFFNDAPWPAWDLLLLGLGSDGHTASLFPGSPVLDESQRWVAPVAAPSHIEPHLPRVTLTLPAINSAACVLFLAAGPGKQSVVRRILDDPRGAANDYPAARVRAAGETRWLIDRQVAGD